MRSMVWLLVCAGCAGDIPAQELFAADRAFNASVAQKGSEAWVRWFAPDGMMIQAGPGVITGHEAIRTAASFLDVAGTVLSWEPVEAHIARRADMGWTRGHYTYTTRSDTGMQVSRGVYVTVWHRQPDGLWKVAVDVGNPIAEAGGEAP
ncbi:MAG TPA: nuclear transport factor 2 family protein [Gemmatimonadales bacterium]